MSARVCACPHSNRCCSSLPCSSGTAYHFLAHRWSGRFEVATDHPRERGLLLNGEPQIRVTEHRPEHIRELRGTLFIGDHQPFDQARVDRNPAEAGQPVAFLGLQTHEAFSVEIPGQSATQIRGLRHDLFEFCGVALRPSTWP
jgi:hypothetical protein